MGEIENLPISDGVGDVVVSNCVINLVPNKEKAFNEIHRVLKPGGHFCISDIVLRGILPEALRKSAEMYAGCVAGALQQDEYLGCIKKAGFSNVEIKSSKTIQIPDSVLEVYLKGDEIAMFKKSNVGIISITVVGYR